MHALGIPYSGARGYLVQTRSHFPQQSLFFSSFSDSLRIFVLPLPQYTSSAPNSCAQAESFPSFGLVSHRKYLYYKYEEIWCTLEFPLSSSLTPSFTFGCVFPLSTVERFPLQGTVFSLQRQYTLVSWIALYTCIRTDTFSPHSTSRCSITFLQHYFP